MALAPGSRFGSYEITALLGIGGMGEVYRARDSRLQREVAIKVLPEALQADPERLSRFEREAQTASNLNHPNILTIFEIGEVAGTRFMAAEFVAGETLGARLARGSLPLVEAIDVATQMATGVAAAHAAGIVHRDLKPDNVMIRPDGLVKVLDFGLAKAVERRVADSLSETVAQTSTGTIAGTVRYMSPEQARGLPVDARSDVFSLGAVLYETLCGQPPFPGATATDVMVAILDRAPAPLAARRPDAPRDLQAVVGRCLEKDAARRYGSARELLGALQALATSSSQTVTAADTPPSIAILPFANMSADPENEYFCDGIAEEITNALVKVERLKVAGRTSAFSFKGKTGDLREIGRALNVSTVLEGSVRKAGSRLRITAQLVKVADGYHLWSERYDRQMEDIFEVQDEIALAVVEALKVTLLGGEKAAVVKRSTNNPEAYNLCLKARHAWTRWTDEGFRTAFSLFEQALEKDPSYALAHFGLGDCYAAWALLGFEPANLSGMRTRMETALRLEPDLVEAQAVLGAIVVGVYEYDWRAAAHQCQTAIATNPRSAHALNVYGVLLNVQGRHEESLSLMRRAVDLDPLNPTWNACFLQALLGTRVWDDVFEQARVTRDLAPDSWFGLQLTGQAQAATGRLDDAIVTFERAERTSADAPYTVGLLSNALARAGRRSEALDQLARLRTRADSHYVPLVALAYAHAGLGDVEEAFTLLERAVDAHDAWLTYSLTDFATLDDLRPDPRFQALRRRIGL
jgi:serine/threonine-protein kinase